MSDSPSLISPESPPDGVIWCERPEDMQQALLTRGTLLVLTPFVLGSSARDAVAKAVMTKRMKSHERHDEERFRPPFEVLGLDEDPYGLAQKIVRDGIEPQENNRHLVLGITKGLEIIQRALGADLNVRLEGQTRNFYGYGHTDDCTASGTLVLNGTTMTAYVGQKWYQLPHNSIGIWWGKNKHALGNPLWHWHGVTEPHQPCRYIVGAFSNGPSPAING